MTCFRLPQWVIARIDRVRLAFMWGKGDASVGGMSLTNWSTVCLPRSYGGLGVSNLNLVNISLLLRWWWKAYHEPYSLWSVTIKRIRSKGSVQLGPKIWIRAGSFFWNQLNKIKPVFNWSTSWELGDGHSVSYWFDSWQGAPRAVHKVPHSQKPAISLYTAWLDIRAVNPEELQLTAPTLMPDTLDAICWKWSSNGLYSANSAYRMMMQGGLIRWRYKAIWTIKLPPTVKIFIYMVLHGKILSRDVLRRRGMNLPLNCDMCRDCPVESTMHLLYLCPYAVNVWFEVSKILNKRIMAPAMTVQGIWDASWEVVRTQGGITKKKWMVMFSCVSWAIWKQRNAVVFGDQRLPAHLLAGRCTQEVRLWLKLC